MPQRPSSSSRSSLAGGRGFSHHSHSSSQLARDREAHLGPSSRSRMARGRALHQRPRSSSSRLTRCKEQQQPLACKQQPHQQQTHLQRNLLSSSQVWT